MAQATLTRILEEIKTFQPQELREVERTVRELLEVSSQEAEREAILRYDV